MNDKNLNMQDLKLYTSYYNNLGIDINALLNEFTGDDLTDKEPKTKCDNWFAEQMDGCFKEALKEKNKEENKEKYKYLLISC